MQGEKVWKDVHFYSDGLKLSAHFYPARREPGAEARPAILSLPGYSGMKDIYGMEVPRRLWKQGYNVLAIDHRGFGTSAGTRGRHRPLEQAQDAYDALTYLQTLEGVDPHRLGIYGTSFGGANAIWVTAFDARVKVVVSSVKVSDGERWMRGLRRPWEFAALRQQLAAASRERVNSGTASRSGCAGRAAASPPMASSTQPMGWTGLAGVRRLDEGLSPGRRGLRAQPASPCHCCLIPRRRRSRDFRVSACITGAASSRRAIRRRRYWTASSTAMKSSRLTTSLPSRWPQPYPEGNSTTGAG